MKLSDKGFCRFEAISILCGVLSFCFAACVWFAMSRVNWFSFWDIPATIVFCWALGGIAAWLTTKDTNNIPKRTYLLTNCTYLIITFFNVSSGDPSINGWYVLFCIGFAIVSAPGYVVMFFVTDSTSNSPINKKIVYSIAISFVLLVTSFFVSISFMEHNATGYRETDMKANCDSIVEAIESYLIANQKLPETMSQLHFDQTIEGYCFKGHGEEVKFRYIPLQDNDYLIDVFNDSEDSVVSQYSSARRKWETKSENMELYKLETHAIALYSIKNIFGNGVDSSPYTLDSIKQNDNIRIIFLGETWHPDSLGYLTVRYETNKKRMEGWIAFDSHAIQGDSFFEIGSWKYYNEQGYIFRKFWNYMKNNELIYEPDR